MIVWQSDEHAAVPWSHAALYDVFFAVRTSMFNDVTGILYIFPKFDGLIEEIALQRCLEFIKEIEIFLLENNQSVSHLQESKMALCYTENLILYLILFHTYHLLK